MTVLDNRIRQIFEYLESLPPEQEVVQGDIMKALGLSSGTWNIVQNWLNLIVFIQSQPKLGRRFIPFGKKKKLFKTKYRLEDSELRRFFREEDEPLQPSE